MFSPRHRTRLGGPALARQSPLALHVIAGFVQCRLRGGKLGLSLVQGVALRHRVELGDKVVWPYHLPNFHMALDHAPVDAECEVLLLLGADVARE